MQKKTIDKEIIEPKTKKKSTKATATKTTKTAKSAVKEVVPKKSTVKADTKKVEKKSKKPAAKKITTKKATAKKDEAKTTAKKSATQKATAKKTTNNKKAIAKKTSTKKKEKFIDVPEYYDLPYRYNETTVKILAQNPNTLFIYWDISDNDRASFEDQYGKDFFYKTKPVLVIHNLTEHYTYEIQIDDFANNWYVHVNDTKCKYIAELGRKPIDQTDDLAVGYISVYYSNEIETPNDHVLFYQNNQVINFRNIRTNKLTQRIINLSDKFKKQIKEIYKNYNLTEEENYFDFQNPSSQNPSSTFI